MKKNQPRYFKLWSSTAYVNFVRLRLTFFTLISFLFILSIAIGLIFQGSYFILLQFESPSTKGLVFIILGLPSVFIICAIIIDDMVSLIFDCMDKPPFLSLRARMCTAFFKTESRIISSLSFANYLILLSIEIIPVVVAIIYGALSNSFSISNITTGYIVGGVLLSYGFCLVMVVSHAFNSYSRRAQDVYFDFLKKLEKSEAEHGSFSLNKETFGEFLTVDYDPRAKKPKTNRAILFGILSMLLLALCLASLNANFLNMANTAILISITLLLVSISISSLMPNFLGPTYFILVVIFMTVTISLSISNDRKLRLFNVNVFPVLAKQNIHFEADQTNTGKYPICNMRWYNQKSTSSDNFITLLDVIPVAGVVYSAPSTRNDDRPVIESVIKTTFENTNLSNVEIEYLNKPSEFGRSVVIYFRDQKIRLMAIRGTVTLSELLYDFNIYSIPQSLHIFDKLTPVISILPDQVLRTLVKNLSLDNAFLRNNKFDSILKIAKEFKEKSDAADDEFIIAGHSLGGVFAGIISAKLGVPGIALSSAGLNSMLLRFGVEDDDQIRKNLTTVILEKDLVSKVDKHLGSINEITCKYGADQCHNPLALLCEVYHGGNDTRNREILVDCSQEGVDATIKRMFQ